MPATTEPASGDAPRLSAIVVNFNTCDLLVRALRAIAAASTDLATEVIVVDNGSRDDSVAFVRAQFPAVRVIANDGNRGFAGATNQGIAAARGDAILLLNSDAAPEPGALTTLLAALDADPLVGVVGPRLLNADGTTQSSRRRFPTLATLLVESTHLAAWRPFRSTVQHYAMIDSSNDHAQSVDWLVGACLLARREAIETVGPLDSAFFMYAEELEWQWRVRQAGWTIWYEPAARVLHDGGRSSAPDSPIRHQAHQASRVRLTRLLYGRPVGELVRAWLLVLDAVQLLIETAKWLLGHKPALRRQRVALYGALIRSGLAMPAPRVSP